jgi:hypothetical protein
LLTYGVMLDFLIVAYVQLMIMLRELEKLLSVQITLNTDNLKEGVFVCVTRPSLSYPNEPYEKLWM